MAQVMSFEVGEVEKHTVSFDFDYLWGFVTISIDGRTVDRSHYARQPFFDHPFLAGNYPMSRSWRWGVGTSEVHDVQIDMHRDMFWGEFRPMKVYGFVDGELVALGAVSRFPWIKA